MSCITVLKRVLNGDKRLLHVFKHRDLAGFRNGREPEAQACFEAGSAESAADRIERFFTHQRSAIKTGMVVSEAIYLIPARVPCDETCTGRRAFEETMVMQAVPQRLGRQIHEPAEGPANRE